MAKCLITESDGVAGKYGTPVMLPGITQAVTYAGSTTSAAFGSGTNLIRVVANAEVYLLFGASPTADANDIRILKDTVEYFAVRPGEKVACYDGTT